MLMQDFEVKQIPETVKKFKDMRLSYSIQGKNRILKVKMYLEVLVK